MTTQMAPKLVPGSPPVVLVHIGGEQRALKFTLGTFNRIQATEGKSPEEVAAMLDEARSGDKAAAIMLAAERLPAILWAMLAHGQDTALTVEEVADMIAFDQMEQLIDAVNLCVQVSLPQKGKDKDPPVARPASARRGRAKAGK